MSTDYSAYQENLIRGNLLGYNKELTDNLLLGVNYERSYVERSKFANVINRDTGSISLSYLDIDHLKIFTKFECREDKGKDSKTRQWLTQNEGLWYITKDISILAPKSHQTLKHMTLCILPNDEIPTALSHNREISGLGMANWVRTENRTHPPRRRI